MACPACRGWNWTVRAEKEEAGDVIEGRLVCACGRAYPIKDSVVFFEIEQEKDIASVWNEIFSKTGPEVARRDVERTRKNVESGLGAQSCLMARLLSRRPEAFKTYLDIGCGSGFFSWLIHTVRPRMEFTLLDYSVPGMLHAKNTMRAAGVDVDLVQGDAFRLPFRDGVFSLSSTAGLLEHFEEEKQREILREQARISSNILCQIPLDSPGYWILRKFIETRDGKWPFGVEKPLRKRKMFSLLREEGWEPRAAAAQSLLTVLSLHVFKIRRAWFYRLFSWTEKVLAYDLCVFCERGPARRGIDRSSETL